MIKGFEDYTGRYDYVLSSHKQNGLLSDNGQLFTAHALVLLAKKDQQGTIDLYQDRWNMQMLQTEIEPGLYKRSPEHDSDQSVDNLIGIAAASYWLKTDHARLILSYGRQHNFVWNTYSNPEQHAMDMDLWLGRQPGTIAFLEMCAGETPNYYGRLALLAGAFLTGFENDQATSNRLLQWLMLQCLDENPVSKLTEFLMLRDITKFSNQHGTGIGAIARTYFGVGHPIVPMFEASQ